MILYEYIPDLAKKTAFILKKYNLALCSVEMRVGKTTLYFETAKLLGKKNILLITTKKAIQGIIDTYLDNELNYERFFELKVINYEQLHNLTDFEKYDLIVVDESHKLGAIKGGGGTKSQYNNRQKNVKKIAKGKQMILGSGTFTPESLSQIWNICQVSEFTPFEEKTFIKFASKYINVYTKPINGYNIAQYDRPIIDKIYDKINPLLVEYTQSDAGFKQQIIEEIEIIPTPQGIKDLAFMAMKKNMIYFKKDNQFVEINIDNAAVEQSKLQQLCSGTILDNDSNGFILSDFKAKHIKEKYANEKKIIFYNFRAERRLLEKYFEIAETIKEYNESKNPNMIFCSQIKSGAEGINASESDIAIYFNVNHSGVAYAQSRQRINTRHREKLAKIIFICSELGIELEIIKRVRDKKDFTSFEYARYVYEKMKNINQLKIEV